MAKGGMIFQSTLSIRRATKAPEDKHPGLLFQSTLSVRRATGAIVSHLVTVGFQSTLSVRRATGFTSLTSVYLGFQSTLSVRRATNQSDSCFANLGISIHALRKESDIIRHDSTPSFISFQSTLSVRRATFLARNVAQVGLFQSTLSVRRATAPSVGLRVDGDISIHALRKESDHRSSLPAERQRYFNPRSP